MYRLINAYLEAYYKLSRNKGRKNLLHFRQIGYEPRILVEALFSSFFVEYVQFQVRRGFKQRIALDENVYDIPLRGNEDSL